MQLRSLFEWVALIVSIAGYIQVYSESGQRQNPLSEMTSFIDASGIKLNYYEELKQAGLFPSFDSIVSPKDYCATWYPTAKTNYDGALLAANCYLWKKNTQEAFHFLNIANQLDDNQVEPYYYRGLLYLSLGQYTQGRFSLQQAFNATSDTVWRGRIKRELSLSTINIWVPFLFAIGSIFMVGLEIAKNLGLEISSKKWLAMFIGILVIWAFLCGFIITY